MKLKKFQVNGLFGVFDHEIELNEKGITIIIGENGLGKTIVLEMIESFFNSNFYYFSQVVFDRFVLTFSDGVEWEMNKSISENDSSDLYITEIKTNGKKSRPYNVASYKEQDVRKLAIKISRNIPHLRRVAVDCWEHRRTLKKYYAEDLIKIYGSQISYDEDISFKERPKWFLNRHPMIDVSLIETQRLINTVKSQDESHQKTVEKYSDELSKTIKAYLSQSTELSSKLDRTYPNRLIEKIKNHGDISDDELQDELKKLESNRKLLDAVGLIEIEKDSNLLEIEAPQQLVKQVLMLYVEDSSNKIEIFDIISQKIKILLDIINKRFKHKDLHIDKEDGFVFISTIIKDKHGIYQRIPVTKLSSGEQNELVLFYLLLFETKENSLILIDEPEVSLHISWQNSFIKDLKEIIVLNKLEIIIATHSPDIIADNWELKVDLKGLE